jgi:metal-responsive CopG/Arc/MetJ family transcriptional regulator
MYYMKDRITITIDKELLNWLDKKIAGKVFANRSHGLEFLVKKKIGLLPNDEISITK